MDLVCTCTVKSTYHIMFMKHSRTLHTHYRHAIYSRLSLSRTRLSRITVLEVKNLVPVLTQRSTNRQQNIVEKGRSNFSFSQYFQYISNLGVKLKIHSVKCGCCINCFPQFRKSDMSKYGYLEIFHRVPCTSR